MKVKQKEIDAILDSKLLHIKKIRLQSIPFKGDKSLIYDACTNISKIYDKKLTPFEIVEREILGYQPNK